MREERRTAAADGTSLRYTVHGAGRRRIVLTHSLAMSAGFWDRVTAALGPGSAVLAWDCRGHGTSGKPAGPYAVEQFADDLVAVLDHAGWPQAIAAGASMGGCVTVALAVRHPSRVQALGLFDTTAGYGREAQPSWEERAQAALQKGLASMAAFQQSRWFSDDFHAREPEAVERCTTIFRANDPAAYAEVCRMLGRVDLYASLPGIRVPTAVVVGEEDYATPVAMAEALHQGIVGSTIEVIAGVRHLTPVECPERIAAVIDAVAARAGT